MSAGAAADKPLKVGIVCEGQVGCAEDQVFPELIKLICPTTKWDIVPSGNRPKVFKEAPIQAKKLLATGCDVVFVMWDVWPDHGGSTDCKEHCKTLDDNLKAAKMADKPIIPIAIRQTLEAWLICDGDALTAAIGPLPRKKRIPHEKAPDDVANPKKVLEKLFRLGRGKIYNPSLSAKQIAAKLTSTKRLRKSQSFARFEDRLKKLCDG